MLHYIIDMLVFFFFVFFLSQVISKLVPFQLAKMVYQFDQISLCFGNW